MRVGRTDTFEQRYVQRFRDRFGEFGLFLNYEMDRAARDIGLHLTRKAADGGQLVSSVVCWFQLKGIMKSTLSAEQFAKSRDVSLSLEVSHLRCWFLLPTPTYLTVYVESEDSFLVCDIREYVEREWGREILVDDQKTRTVRVSKQSTLDSTALWQMLTRGDADQWARVLSVDVDEATLAVQDYKLIWRLGTAIKRNVTHNLQIVDWQSKTRTELNVRECDSSGALTKVHSQWAFMLSPAAMLDMMPYAMLVADDADEDLFDESDWFGERAPPTFALPDGSQVAGTDFAGEAFIFDVQIFLSPVGERMFSWIEQMVTAGAIEVNLDGGSFISLAPWHRRSV